MPSARLRLRGEVPRYDAEKRYVRKDGAVIWVQVSAVVVRDRDGRPLRSAGTVQDITARKRAEDELRRYREHLEELVEERTAEMRATDDFLVKPIEPEQLVALLQNWLGRSHSAE